jgi:hypothetical protein
MCVHAGCMASSWLGGDGISVSAAKAETFCLYHSHAFVLYRSVTGSLSKPYEIRNSSIETYEFGGEFGEVRVTACLHFPQLLLVPGIVYAYSFGLRTMYPWLWTGRMICGLQGRDVYRSIRGKFQFRGKRKPIADSVHHNLRTYCSWHHFVESRRIWLLLPDPFFVNTKLF